MDIEKILKDIAEAAAKLADSSADASEARWANHIISARCRDLTDWAERTEKQLLNKEDKK